MKKILSTQQKSGKKKESSKYKHGKKKTKLDGSFKSTYIGNHDKCKW